MEVIMTVQELSVQLGMVHCMGLMEFQKTFISLLNIDLEQKN